MDARFASPPVALERVTAACISVRIWLLERTPGRGDGERRSPPAGGAWLGPQWGPGLADLRIAAHAGEDGRMRQRAVLTETGAALARTPDPYAVPEPPTLAGARAGTLF